MTSAVQTPAKFQLPWATIAYFGALLAVCFAPVIRSLVISWDDPDMGHGYFVPLIAGYIVWQQREELLATKAQPNWWGLVLVVLGGVQLILATLGVELFLTHTSLIVVLIGVVWLMGGNQVLRKLAFPLFLLFFMVPIPAIIYYRITFPLQILASQLAEAALNILNVPVSREGNILELANQRLSVVEACSGIRSLLTLTFLSLVYGHFFEPRKWLRIVLFFATIPIAIIANGSRVTITGIITQIKPELAEGFFHESTGLVIWAISIAILIVFHRSVVWLSRRFSAWSPA